MIDYYNLLQEFHHNLFLKTGDYRNDTGQHFVPGNPTSFLRHRLHKEEIKELKDELMGGTKHALLKELADCLYVLFGTAAVYNLPIDKAFEKVHENNMLKLVTGRVADFGKLIKAPDHPKVDFTDIL